ncbi:Fic family protein [Pedobacter faecalis]|uniref:Fic family protein n=1 Tax=Pedobacter faecalis TaxID=3041495 RepID=UPI00254A32DB|nr:Fic family protein [Pedobacter sp. ELA7]
MDLVKLIDRYNTLGIAQVVDHEKFNHISIVHHSTKIEGSTLTELETRVLLEDGLTPNNKALHDTLMATDHYAALLFTLQEARKKRTVSLDFLKEINSLVLRNTGQVYHTMLGVVDATKGELRLGNVQAGITYFPNYNKLVPLLNDMISTMKELMQKTLTVAEQINLSFDAHYNLVNIHPWYDGNGRTSRLLMNYVQCYYDLPLAIVHNESKPGYITALNRSLDTSDLTYFREFMSKEYAERLKAEIKRFEEIDRPRKGKGFRLMF